MIISGGISVRYAPLVLFYTLFLSTLSGGVSGVSPSDLSFIRSKIRVPIGSFKRNILFIATPL